MTITARDLMKDLEGAVGENAQASAIQGYLDTGLPELNFALSGRYDRGAPQGRFMEIFGPASAGKTFISTMLMAAAQAQGGIAFFADHERSFSPEFAETLGLDVDPAVFKHLRPRTFEDSIEAFMKAAPLVREKGLPMDVPCIWILDSIAAMIPRAKLLDDKGKLTTSAEYNMRDKLALPTCCSQNYPILKQFAEDYNFTVVALNQIRVNPGVMFGDPTTTPGGKAAEFYADIRVNLGKKDITNGKKGDEKETLGFEITAKAIKNKVGRPHRKATWQVRFHDEMGVYVDQIATNVDFFIRNGILDKDGTGRVEWDGKKIFVKQLVKELKAADDGYEQLMALLPKEKSDDEE